MNKKIILLISLMLLVGLVVFVSAQDSAQSCPEGQIWYNGQCMVTGSTEPPEVIYGCEKGEKWNEAERKCIPSGDSTDAGIAPASWRKTSPNIPSDEEILRKIKAQWAKLDVDKNGKITKLDAEYLMKYSTGLTIPAVVKETISANPSAYDFDRLEGFVGQVDSVYLNRAILYGFLTGCQDGVCVEAPTPTAGTCPQGCTCTANSISCTTNAETAPIKTRESDRDTTGGSAPTPTAGTCPQECTCTENAISCTLGEESPSADAANSETGAGSGQTEKGRSIVEITRNKEQQTMSINVGETKALTTAEVIIKERKLYVKSGATEKQVKIMPNTASEIAVERLGNLGFTIELKETGNYELKAEKQARLLFIFPLTAQVSANINAENGKINSINKPWWSFLASGI